MAGGGAGALLLRAAALGGLTAAAWLLGGTDASASPEEPPAVEITTEATRDAPQLLEDPAGWAKALTAAVLDQHQPAELVPPPVVTKPQEPEEEPAEDGPVLDYTSSYQGNTRSGAVTNQAPPEVVKAKAQARAAAKVAKAAALAPPPPPPPPAPPVVAVKKVVPQLHDSPVPAPVKTEPAPASDFNWSAPGPDAPLPAPQQAPVVATASASSGHSDNSGGTRGVLAVLTSHNSLFPPSTWSVGQRRDGRSPGSLPGLPSTSPD